MVTTILRWYIAKITFISILFVAAVLMALETFVILLNEMTALGEHYSFITIILYGLSILPNNLYQLLPMIVLVGVLLGLNFLNQHQELMVMQISGVSRWQIILSALMGSFLLILPMTWLGESFFPALQHRAETNKRMALSPKSDAASTYDLWLRLDHAYIHVGETTAKTQKNLTAFLWKSSDTFWKIHADWAANHGIPLTWQWHDVTIQQINSKEIQVQHQAVYEWSMPFKSQWLNSLSVEADHTLSLQQLIDYSDYRAANGLDNFPQQLFFWQRLLKPFVTVLMVILAVPFALGPVRQSKMGYRALLGLGLSFAFFVINEVGGAWAIVLRVPPFWAAISPIMLFVGLVLLFYYIWLNPRKNSLLH